MQESMRRIGPGLRLAAASVAILAATASTANAAVATVNPFGCAFFGGGQATRPAGSTIVIRQGLAQQTRGVLTAQLGAQTTTLSVNGGDAVDLTRDWSAPAQAPDGSWVTVVDYPTGVTLGAGQSLTFTFTLTLDHPVPEVLVPPVGGDAGKPLLGAAGSQAWACTVTGV
jgi:hypothetical protein